MEGCHWRKRKDKFPILDMPSEINKHKLEELFLQNLVHRQLYSSHKNEVNEIQSMIK